MNFYTLLEEAITSDDIGLKEQQTLKCLEYCNAKSEATIVSSTSPKEFTIPSYAKRCQIVDPRELPARKDFETAEGLATLVHAIAHIEYSAIDLALDAVYRYRHMPREYQRDWLEVAADEIRHYQMLTDLLYTLGFAYGDFPVHSGLFDASIHTADDIQDRMAVIPRYYEASGLDVNPQIIKKLQNRDKIAAVKTLIDTLNVIYDEEILHVQKGDKWFRYLCEQEHLAVESEYMRILEKYALTNKHRPHINVKARKEAGFTCSELLKLGAKKCQE